MLLDVTKNLPIQIQFGSKFIIKLPFQETAGNRSSEQSSSQVMSDNQVSK